MTFPNPRLDFRPPASHQARSGRRAARLGAVAGPHFPTAAVPRRRLRAPEGSGLCERGQAAALRACRHLRRGRGLESTCPRGQVCVRRSPAPPRPPPRRAFAHSSPCLRHRRRGPLCRPLLGGRSRLTLVMAQSRASPCGPGANASDRSALRTRHVSEALGTV